MNRLDLRVLYSKLQTGILLLPWLIAYYGGKFLSAVASWIERFNSRTREWANPDLHGKVPLRARKLLYRRRTVERLCDQIESQKRIIKKLSGETEGPP